MSPLSMLDMDGGNGRSDPKKIAFFLDDFFSFCSDRLVVLVNGDSCKFWVFILLWGILVMNYELTA